MLCVTYTGPMVRKVLLASPRGYCAGVERAVETVERALELYGPPVYVRKQIVHNLHVVRELEERGAVFVDDERDVPVGQTVVLSAHGIAPSVLANAAAAALHTIDATCPLVTKVHVQARRYAADGYTVILIGHAGHEEVVGTMGEAPGAIVLVETAEDVEALAVHGRRPARVRDADDAVGRRDRDDDRGPAPPLPLDPRAEARGHLLRDLQPPVGGQGDAGRDRPAARGRLAQLVELEPPRRGRPGRRGRVVPDRRCVGDRRGVARGRLVVGLTSGASAPEKLVAGVCNWFRDRGVREIEPYSLVEEDVEFRLPAELRRELALAQAQG